MSQQEVISVLEKFKKPMSRTEIANVLNQDIIMVSHALRRLVKGGEVKIIELDRHQAMERFHCKHRMRLYYVSD